MVSSGEVVRCCIDFGSSPVSETAVEGCPVFSAEVSVGTLVGEVLESKNELLTKVKSGVDSLDSDWVLSALCGGTTGLLPFLLLAAPFVPSFLVNGFGRATGS